MITSLNFPNLKCALVTVIALSACSNQPPYEREQKLTSKERRERLEVLIQVCFPEPIKGDSFQLHQVNRYGDTGEMRSVGGLMCEPIGKTVLGQSVCEEFTSKRPMDLVAILYVERSRVQRWRELVFDTLNKVFMVEKWTPWEQAQTQDSPTEDVGFKLANQREYKVRAPDPQMPKIRYRLVKHEDWDSSSRYKKPEFPKPPQFKEEIPGC